MPDSTNVAAIGLGESDWSRLPLRDRWRDLLLASCIVGGVIFIQFSLAGGLSLFSRNYWIDEILTYRIVSDPEFLHSLQAVQAGIDLSPPGYQLLARSWAAVFGVSEASLRSFAFGTMMLFLTGLYVLLRLSANRLVCCAGVLAVWSHPLIIEHALDARYYAPWLASLTWFCFFWQLGVTRRGCKSALAGVAACSFLACSFHYFAIISLACVVTGELLINRSRRSEMLPLVVASLTGPVALMVYVPMFWMHQIQLSDVSWIPDPTLLSVSRFVLKLLLPRQIAAIAVVVLLQFWLSGATSTPNRDVPRNCIDSSVGLISTIAMIPLLVLVSYFLRPVIFAKYAIPAIACLAPAVVVALRDTHRASAVALIVVFAIAGSVAIAGQRQSWNEDAQQLQQQIAAIEQRTQNRPVYFESPHDLYTVCHYAPQLAEQCFFLDFAPGELPAADAARWRVFNRNHTRVHVQYYPQPATYPWSKLRTAKGFYLMLEDTEQQLPDVIVHSGYPDFSGRRIDGRLYLMLRRDPLEPDAVGATPDSNVNKLRDAETQNAR